MNYFQNKDYRKILGTKGEEAVLKHYEARKFKLLEKNWRRRIGEIDLIFQKKDTLIFVEVKTASSENSIKPIENITEKKQKKLTNLANLYLATHSLSKKIKNIRIDAAEVLEKNGAFEINVIENIIEL
jgi:putative endonuclease